MIKIVRVVNAMLSHRDKITDVKESTSEAGSVYFFLYNGKYKWSISRTAGEGSYFLHFYPGPESLELLASCDVDEWAEHDPASVFYSTRSLKSKEANESFAELFKVIREKLYNVEEILDEILKSADDVSF